MRRVLLILAVILATVVAKKVARAGVSQQQQLLWALLLATLASPSASSAPSGGNTAKTKSLEGRVAGVVSALATPVSVSSALAANATFLATLRLASTPIGAGTLGLSFTGPGGAQSVPNLYSYLNGGFATLMSSLIAYTAALGTCVNSIITQGGNANIWP
jgi:ABC-type Co2+ transport system permease subunit